MFLLVGKIKQTSRKCSSFNYNYIKSRLSFLGGDVLTFTLWFICPLSRMDTKLFFIGGKCRGRSFFDCYNGGTYYIFLSKVYASSAIISFFNSSRPIVHIPLRYLLDNTVSKNSMGTITHVHVFSGVSGY